MIAFVLAAVLLYFTGRQVYIITMKALYPIDYSEYVQKYSREYGVKESLIYAVINCESSFDSNAVSYAGAKGLMQITPETFEWLQTNTPEDEQLSSDELFVPETAIKYGTLLLSLHLQEFAGDVGTAMAAYHAGRGIVNKWLEESEHSDDGATLGNIPYGDTNSYVKKVIKGEEVYQKLYGLE